MTYSGACTLPVPKIGDRPLEIMPVIHTHRHRYERGTHPPATWRERTAAAPAARQSADACFLAHSGAAARRAVPCRRRRFARLWRQLGAARRAGQLEQFVPRDAVASCAGADSGSLMTRRWREMDSNPRSPAIGTTSARRPDPKAPGSPMGGVFDRGVASQRVMCAKRSRCHIYRRPAGYGIAGHRPARAE